MKRDEFDVDSEAFYKEVSASFEGAKGPDAKSMVLGKAMMALRSRTFADAAVIGQETGAPSKTIKGLLLGAQMFLPEGEWRKFAELLYPKTGPLRAKLEEISRKNGGPAHL